MGSLLAPSGRGAAAGRGPKAGDGGEDGLDSRDRVDDIAKFPYVEFTGQDSVTCPTCHGTGCIPTEQVNELVALIPYSDQRLRPQRTKLYVLLSVLLCLLLSGLVVFFLFPRSVLVDDDGIKVVQVWFDKKNSVVILAITATLRVKNSNFYSVTVTSLASQVQYMNTVVGTQQISSVSSIQPLSDKLVNFTVKAELGGPFSYVYFFCTFPKVKVHNIVIFMRTSVKLSYIGHATQSSLETYHYVDCSTNSTAAPDARPRRSLAPRSSPEAQPVFPGGGRWRTRRPRRDRRFPMEAAGWRGGHSKAPGPFLRRSPCGLGRAVRRTRSGCRSRAGPFPNSGLKFPFGSQNQRLVGKTDSPASRFGV